MISFNRVIYWAPDLLATQPKIVRITRKMRMIPKVRAIPSPASKAWAWPKSKANIDRMTNKNWFILL